MLLAGELDALIHPHPPHDLFEGTDRVRRLFPDAKAECIRHFDRHGFYPIMHLMAFTEELVDREPWLPRAVIDMWEDAKHQTEALYTDPGYSIIALARNELEAQADYLCPDPWPSGVAANRADLERFIGFCHDQRLIDEPIALERLFHESVLDS
jgi:4,5-dihydroxyphthalate decarboxylase